MRILITGSAGMVGSAIKKVFKDYELLLTDKDTLDVGIWKQAESYLHAGIDLVIHLAAETDLELCEINPALAYLTNHTGTLNMKLFCAKLDIPIVYISTAGIFDGNRGYYYEHDEPCPINHYGRSKLYGEYALSDYEKKYIFRCGWMMGGGIKIDKKFVNKIFKQIREEKKVIYALDDFLGSPTYTLDLAKTIKKAIETKIPYGIYNCAGEGMASRYEIACEFVKCLGVKTQVKKAESGQFDKDFSCPRSKNEILFNNKLRLQKVSCMRDWHITLKEYSKCFRKYLP